MKALHLLIVAVLFTAKVFSQSYDFATKQFTGIGPKNSGSMVHLRVNNINTFRYKVTIKGSQVDFVTPIPTELQALFRVSDVTQKLTETTEGVAKSEGAKNDMQHLQDTLLAGPLKVEMSKLVTLCANFLDKASQIKDIKNRRAELISLARQNWPNHEALSLRLTKPPLRLDFMLSQIQSFFDAYQLAEIQYDLALEAAKATPATNDDERIKAALERFEDGYNNIEEGDLVKVAQDVDVLQNALNDPGNFTVTSPGIQAEGDFLVFDVKIEPDQTNALLPHEQATVSRIEIPVRNSWKADFSVGPNFSFGYESKDHKYYLEPTSGGDGILYKAKNAGIVRPGVAAMIHAYSRSGKDLNAGFLMGVGAGFKADDALTATYYLGGSIIAGKIQKLMLNGGISFLQVQRLKAGYQTGKTYSIESTKIPDLTENILRPSIFLGISYNITNRTDRKNRPDADE